MKNDLLSERYWGTRRRSLRSVEALEVNNGNVGGVTAQSNCWNAVCGQPGAKAVALQLAHDLLYSELYSLSAAINNTGENIS
jgi:hypothetical protein